MARSAEETQLADVRGKHLIVIGHAQLFHDKVLKLLTNNRSVGRPKYHAGTACLVDMEELKFFAQLTMITSFSLLESFKIFSEFVFTGESGAVNTL